MIYLLQDSYKDDNGKYQDILKIGYSKDHFSKNRLGQYNTHNFGYKFLGERDGSPELEHYLHKVLKKFNLGREWFRYDQEVIDRFWNAEEDLSKFTSQGDLNEYIRYYILKILVPSVNNLRKLYQQKILDEIKEKCESSEDFEYDEELYTREIIRAFSWICQKETEYFEKLNFSIPDIQEKLIESNLVLPQRNKENPFKNNVVVFYKTLRKDNVMSREEFDILQDSRRGATQKLLDIYNKVTQVEKKEYLRKIRDGIVVSGYSDDFVSISRKTGKPVYNTLIDLANERAWEVSQKDYQDKISVTKSLDSISRSLEIKSKLEQDIQDFLDFHFYKTELFNEKMKMYCEFMDLHKGEEGLEQILQAKIGNPDFKKYYNFYGTKGCSAKEYCQSYLEQGMLGTLKKDEYIEQIHFKFNEGDRLTKAEIRLRLQEIYTALGLTGKPRASDLGKYFSLTRSIITDPQTKKKYEGYRLGKL